MLDWKNEILRTSQDMNEWKHWLFYCPDEYLLETWRAFNKDDPFPGHSIKCELEKLNLTQKALESAFHQVENARQKGYGTHAQGHAIGSCFGKILEIFSLCMIQIQIDSPFREVLNRYIEEVKINYEPIKQVLCSGVKFEGSDDYIELSHAEKKVLLRAFYSTFDQAWTKIYVMNWKDEYSVFWRKLFDLFKERNKEKIENQKKMPELIKKCGICEADLIYYKDDQGKSFVKCSNDTCETGIEEITEKNKANYEEKEKEQVKDESK